MLNQGWGICGFKNHKVRPSGPAVKNAKFCNEYEIYVNDYSEVIYEILGHRCAP